MSQLFYLRGALLCVFLGAVLFLLFNPLAPRGLHTEVPHQQGHYIELSMEEDQVWMDKEYAATVTYFDANQWPGSPTRTVIGHVTRTDTPFSPTPTFDWEDADHLLIRLSPTARIRVQASTRQVVDY